ncbi:MAG: Gfo/Idh/MocA family oxidoreductase [Anaerolineae bacterium]|nr:Gfo/Idh/MocA family oxidoreductase [Anaerolineae bacterium]
MSKILKVGVVGVGGIAHTHMPGWEKSDLAEVVAGSDVSEEILAKWGKENNVSNLSTRMEDLINDPDIDIIDVCTPSAYHAPISIAALKAGKHVICEKPLAPTPEEVRAMIAARDESGKYLMTAQHMRFHELSQSFKREIDNGQLGHIYHGRAWWLRRAAYPTRASFWMKKHSGGGPCIDIGVHVLDLALWLMGNPKPVTVSGISRTQLADKPGMFSSWGGGPVPAEHDVEDFAAGFVRFENGATMIVETSWILHHQAPDDGRQIWLYGEDGGIVYNDAMIYKTNYATKQLYNTKLELTSDPIKPHARECMEFARAISEGLPSPVPAEQSLQVMQILDGIYRSTALGAEIRLD